MGRFECVVQKSKGMYKRWTTVSLGLNLTINNVSVILYKRYCRHNLPDDKGFKCNYLKPMNSI